MRRLMLIVIVLTLLAQEGDILTTYIGMALGRTIESNAIATAMLGYGLAFWLAMKLAAIIPLIYAALRVRRRSLEVILILVFVAMAIVFGHTTWVNIMEMS